MPRQDGIIPAKATGCPSSVVIHQCPTSKSGRGARSRKVRAWSSFKVSKMSGSHASTSLMRKQPRRREIRLAILSLSKHDFDAEPDRADDPCRDDGNDSLERIALGFFHARPPAPQVLEICAQLLPVLLLDAERVENGEDRPGHHGVDLVTL